MYKFINKKYNIENNLSVIFLRQKLTMKNNNSIMKHNERRKAKFMLKKFKVKNYKNFKEELSLDFTEKHDYKFNEYCIKNNIINKAIIFGNNGEGKSNLGYALFDIVGTLTDKKTINEQVNNFLNADSDCEYAEFYYEFEFNQDDVKYIYKKSEFKKMIYEELYINDEKIYDYDFNNKKFGTYNMEKIKAETLNFEYYESNIAILRYIVNNTTLPDDSGVKKIMNFATKMLYFRSLNDNNFIGLESEIVNVDEWIITNNLIKEFNQFLKENANLNINVEGAKVIEKNMNILVEKHKKRPLLFGGVASSGTKALLLYFYWYKHFKDIEFLFIDEFDAFYHFKLSKNIIKNLLEYNNMQTILTSHNTYIATNDLLRPDCYFILENGIIKALPDRTERELREGHNLEKMLRQGEFNE